MKEMLGREVGSVTIKQVIVSEMVPHKDEFLWGRAIHARRSGGARCQLWRD